MSAGYPHLTIVDIPDVTTARRAAVLAQPAVMTGPPIVLLHGILDNATRWFTKTEAESAGLQLAIRRPAYPLYDPEARVVNGLARVTPRMTGTGLALRLAHLGRPALAVSYQDERLMIADMAAAVKILHRSIDWLMERTGATRVDLIGHSRGGLVCQHGLLTDSPIMSVREARRRVRRLVTLCTPHLGSNLAHIATPIEQRFIDWLTPIERHFPSAPNLAAIRLVMDLLRNLGQLRPESEEVQTAAAACGDGIERFVIAGDRAAYFVWEVPMLGAIRLPPALEFPEWTDGSGDLAVSVASALGRWSATPDRGAKLPVNHLTATFDERVQDHVIRWLGPK